MKIIKYPASKLVNFISVHNEKIAVWAVRCFGSMWMFWLFFVYGLLPSVPAIAPYRDTFLYYSNFVQLIALPLLLVGTLLTGRWSEVRAQQDHEMIVQELNLMNELIIDVAEVITNVAEVTKEEHDLGVQNSMLNEKLDKQQKTLDELMEKLRYNFPG